MPLLLILFIIVPIIEIGVFIQVGGEIGLPLTLLIIVATAILGVNLLKQQGLKSWNSIQTTMSQGQLPALEMASAVQLLFAGGLLLTPGFFTDIIGFILMLPSVRIFIAKYLIERWLITPNQAQNRSTIFSNDYTEPQKSKTSSENYTSSQIKNGRVIDGEYEDKTQ